MERNNIIGITLIFALFFVWSYLNTPTQEEMDRIQFVKDSTEAANKALEGEKVADLNTASESQVPATPAPQIVETDSMRASRMNNQYSDFAPSASGEESFNTIENDLFKVTFTNKGGRIKEVEIKPYNKLVDNEAGEEVPATLKLMEDEKNRFEYQLPLRNGQTISTQDLFFQPQIINDTTITFRAQTSSGGYFDQKYVVSTDNYNIDYTISHNGLSNILQTENDQIRLNWVSFLDKIEKNVYYEKLYSSVYYKEVEENPDYCSCRADDEEELKKSVKWISQSNQFFNTSLMADRSFGSAKVATVMLEEDSEDLKRLNSSIMVPLGSDNNNTFAMKWYIGPNEFDRLLAYNNDLEDIIPYGWSFFGTINRWVIRPLFNILSGFIGNKGIVILLLTLLVKLALYPLTYKMLHSQSKMAALKPQLTNMKEKHGDDAQKQQMETMKMYREFGVNPLGGCFPIALQMPIWFALYRFFPASIDFRQASFLWASDLSSYDVFFKLGFELPFNMGAHISMFTLLWAVTTLIYTYYNTKHMEMTANPAMKYMQYLMPVMFMGFFNSYASGLTCYLFFSNIFNIGQTIVTKNYIIDQEKIKRELDAYRKKPKKKKKGGFQERLETALKEQQKLAAEKEQQQQKKKKK